MTPKLYSEIYINYYEVTEQDMEDPLLLFEGMVKYKLVNSDQFVLYEPLSYEEIHEIAGLALDNGLIEIS
jgi:hypothetical protein